MQRPRLGIAALVFAGVLAIFSVDAAALQCVPFAREISGISLRGDAWTWWSAAAGQYDRGQAPKIGAVVVFKKHGSMRYGHVAVVTRVLNSREVLVDHANWAPHRGRGRGQIAKLVSVTDISPRNDWTQVRVWNVVTRDYGTRVYPTYGFIYPKSAYAHIEEAVLKVEAMPRPTMPRPQHMAAPQLATADLQIAAALAAGRAAPPAAAAEPVLAAAPVAAPVATVAPVVLAPVVLAPVVLAPVVLAMSSVPAPKAAAALPPAAPAVAPASDDDLALARRFGSGRY